jgi:RpiR family carbohydrate utilization transcriptional regulator
MSLNTFPQNLIHLPHSLVVKIKAVYFTLKSAEKKAMDLLINDPAFFARATISEAAREANCSEATLVRLARRLGFEGYPELKQQLKSDDEPSPGRDEVKLYGSIINSDSYDEVARKVFQASIQALTDTMSILNMDEYKRAVDAISAANMILFCGAGDAGNVARSGYQKFIRAGFNAHVSSDLDLQLIAASQLTENDVVIAVSHSGRTKSVVDLVKYAKTTGAAIISITNYPVSPLAKNSDIILLTAAFEEHAKGEVMSKRLTELCILESLYINTIILQEKRAADKLRKSNAALNVNKI